jgi:putative chitinase
MEKFGIRDREDIAAFIAQLMVESGELNRVVENLSYSTKRLREVWPKRFPDDRTAMRYANNPQALANYVYANRIGNGNEASGDGWRFRGRGPIQTTGRANYLQLERALGIPVTRKPELLETQALGALAAAKFWYDNKLTSLALDIAGDDQEADWVTITRRINGGTEGLARRRQYRDKARKHLGLV